MTKLSTFDGPTVIVDPDPPLLPLAATAPTTTSAAAPDGIAVRPYGHADRAATLRIRLSRHGLYARFHTGTPRLPDFYARTLDEIDHRNREALVALAGTEVVGLAEYARDAARPGSADVAVMVADAWQRRGVARSLMGALAVLAGTRGIGEFRADVLAGNTAARAAIRATWPNAGGVHAGGGLIAFRLPLAARCPATDRESGRPYVS